MAALTCEFLVNRNYRHRYDLNDIHSLAAYHRWISNLLIDALVKKYGRKEGLSVIAREDLWDDDGGLLRDCDFRDLDDGTVLVTFSREPYPPYPRAPGIVTHIEDCGSLGLSLTFSYDQDAVTDSL